MHKKGSIFKEFNDELKNEMTNFRYFESLLTRQKIFFSKNFHLIFASQKTNIIAYRFHSDLDRLLCFSNGIWGFSFVRLLLCKLRLALFSRRSLKNLDKLFISESFFRYFR